MLYLYTRGIENNWNWYYALLLQNNFYGTQTMLRKRKRRRRKGKKSSWNELRENRPIVFCGHPVRNGWLRLANATDRYVIIFASYRIRCWLNGYVRRVPFHPFHRRTYTALLYRVIVTRASNFRDLLNSILLNDDSPSFSLSLSLSSVRDNPITRSENIFPWSEDTFSNPSLSKNSS